MSRRPYKRVPTSPSGPLVSGNALIRRYMANHPNPNRIEAQIQLTDGRILKLNSKTKADLIKDGGKIILPVRDSRRSLAGADKWEITAAGPIIIIPGEFPELQLSDWECKGHYFGLAILDLEGLVRAARGGREYSYMKERHGELKVMNEPKLLRDLIPAE